MKKLFFISFLLLASLDAYNMKRARYEDCYYSPEGQLTTFTHTYTQKTYQSAGTNFFSHRKLAGKTTNAYNSYTNNVSGVVTFQPGTTVIPNYIMGRVLLFPSPVRPVAQNNQTDSSANYVTQQYSQ